MVSLVSDKNTCRKAEQAYSAALRGNGNVPSRSVYVVKLVMCTYAAPRLTSGAFLFAHRRREHTEDQRSEPRLCRVLRHETRERVSRPAHEQNPATLVTPTGSVRDARSVS